MAYELQKEPDAEIATRTGELAMLIYSVGWCFKLMFIWHSDNLSVSRGHRRHHPSTPCGARSSSYGPQIWCRRKCWNIPHSFYCSSVESWGSPKGKTSTTPCDAALVAQHLDRGSYTVQSFNLFNVFYHHSSPGEFPYYKCKQYLYHIQGHDIYQFRWHMLGSGDVGTFCDYHGGDAPCLNIHSNLTAIA